MKKIRITKQDLFEIVQDVLEKIRDVYNPPLILKEYYANDRQRCIAQIKRYLPRVAEHWALIIYAKTICIEAPIEHWCDEIRAFAKQLFPISVKGFDMKRGWPTIVDTALKELKIDSSNLNSNSISTLIKNKFFADYPDTDEETYNYICDLCVPYLHEIIKCIVAQDKMGLEELLQTTLEETDYEA